MSRLFRGKNKDLIQLSVIANDVWIKNKEGN